MKKAMIIIALSGLVGTGAAQHDNGSAAKGKHEKMQAMKDVNPEEHAVRESARMAEKLSLSDEQKEKWRQAVLERHAANAPIKQKMNGSTTPEERKVLRAQMRENRQDFDKKVQEFLTADQKTKLNEHRAARKGKHPGKRHEKKSH